MTFSLLRNFFTWNQQQFSTFLALYLLCIFSVVVSQPPLLKRKGKSFQMECVTYAKPRDVSCPPLRSERMGSLILSRFLASAELTRSMFLMAAAFWQMVSALGFIILRYRVGFFQVRELVERERTFTKCAMKWKPCWEVSFHLTWGCSDQFFLFCSTPLVLIYDARRKGRDIHRFVVRVANLALPPPPLSLTILIETPPSHNTVIVSMARKCDQRERLCHETEGCHVK